MSDIAIRVENISKRYRIGERKAYGTLRETLAGIARSPLRRFGSRENTIQSQPSKDVFIWALKDVSFEVAQGEVVGIIGRNGAGKSTLLKVLSRITKPTKGRAEIHGRVGSLLEVGTGFHPELTGRENIYLNGAILGMKRLEIEHKFDEIVDFAEIEKFLDTPVKRYSSGMYVRLAFAVAAHLEPEILFVDEVLAVGDAAFQKKCLGKMEDVSHQGRTVLFVSHNMAAVEYLCSRALLLGDGWIIQQGSTEEVTSAYLHIVQSQVEPHDDGKWPVLSSDGSIGISKVRARVIQDSTIQLGKLEIEIELIAHEHFSKVGIGCSICTPRGMLVSNIKPAMTSFVINDVDGHYRCWFTCEDICKYLAGGEYEINVWLSWPNVEYLVQVNEAALITVPYLDLYGKGVAYNLNEHGVVPLRMEFTSSHLSK